MELTVLRGEVPKIGYGDGYGYGYGYGDGYGSKMILEDTFVDKKTFFLRHRLGDEAGLVTLYKSVNPKTLCDFKTGNIKYEGVVECPDFDPDENRECGGGLHLSPTPEQALAFHQGKVLKCRVKVEDIVVYEGNLDKVRCRRVEVLGEVTQ